MKGVTDNPHPSPPARTRPVLIARRLDFSVCPQAAYPLISKGTDYSFWLDSAREGSPMSVMSYVGAVPPGVGVLRVEEAHAANPWVALERQLAEAPVPANAAEVGLPEGLRGGYVGFFGYEARTSLYLNTQGYAPGYAARTPDALWLPAVRYLAHEHATGCSWLVGESTWVNQIEPVLRIKAAFDGNNRPPENATVLPAGEPLIFSAPNRKQYLANIAHAQHQIAEGNSYEVCLTAQTCARMNSTPTPSQLFDLYRVQRAHNPAPYAAYLRCANFSVLSSSPEQFLRIDRHGNAQTKPIKGTIERGDTPASDALAAEWLRTDPKTRAENLMIVDLLRNDLSRVSDPASVRVPVLMGVESYATVHQLVSTVSSRLKPGISAVAATAACFPGGSMTGAPKPSTLRIIEELEARARGVYSGALGFFSADGSANLSVVIRTLIAHDDALVTVAAGGAIVADSDPAVEYEEMLTKLRAAIPPSLGRIGLG